MLPLLPDMLRAGLFRLLGPLRVFWRASWIYRRLLGGPLADHIVFHPWDALPRRLEEADSLLRGRFRFHGQTVDVPSGVSVFDIAPPGDAWHTLDAGWAALDALVPEDKSRFVEAIIVAVRDDGVLTLHEAELLRTACRLMHCPLPPFVA